MLDLHFNITTNNKPNYPTHMKSTTMKNTHHNVCLPNLLMRNKASTKSGNNKHVLSPISFMDRLREAMLRLIMVSAISKSAPSSYEHNRHQTNNLRHSYSSPSVSNDQHHSQAVAECIEFIKMRSAYSGMVDEDFESSNEKSSCSDPDSSTSDESHQLGIPSSVM